MQEEKSTRNSSPSIPGVQQFAVWYFIQTNSNNYFSFKKI
jgi:hypothetical protein